MELVRRSGARRAPSILFRRAAAALRPAKPVDRLALCPLTAREAECVGGFAEVADWRRVRVRAQGGPRALNAAGKAAPR